MSEDEEVLDQNANDQEAVEAEVVETVVEEVEKEAPKTETAPPEEIKRPEYTMPVAKAQDEKRKAVERAKEEAKAEAAAEINRLREEYEARLANASQKGPEQDEIRKFAEEHGLDPDAASGLASIIKKGIPVPDLSKYEDILKEREIESHKLRVSQDFDAKVLPLIQKDYPNATPQHIAEVKAKISELAFTQGYNTYPLQDIYRVRQDDFEFKNGFSAEASGGRTSELVDFSKMTDEEEHALAETDPAKFAAYLKEMAKKDSRYTD